MPAWPFNPRLLAENLTVGSAKALGLAHAVTADPPGIDAVHFNPAGLTRLKRRQAELKLISGAFDVLLEFGDGYTDTWTQKLEAAQNGAPEGYTYDEAQGKTSETEGVSVMLPGMGMTEIPVLLGITGGASYSPPGSNVTFATNVYSPLMVGFNRADNDPGRFIGQGLSFTLLTYFSPSVAFKFTDTLSLGVAVTFNYAGVGLDLSFREPNLALQWLELQRQDSCEEANGVPDNYLEFSSLIPCIPESEAIKLYDEMAYLAIEVENPLTFGVNLGLLWDAQPWLHFGVVYQSPINMDMEGEFTWTQGDSFLNFLQAYDEISPVHFADLGPLSSLVDPVTTGTAKLKMTMPDHFAVGTSVQVTTRFKVNADLKFTRWSMWEELPLEYSEPLGVLLITSFVQPEAAPPPAGQAMNLNFGLEDTWNWALGFEYQWNDRLALRMGVEDRPSSIPKEHESPVLPIGDAQLYSIGAEYTHHSDHVFNFAVASVQSETFMPGNTSKVGNSEDPRLLIYNPYSGSDIKASLNALVMEASYRFSW